MNILNYGLIPSMIPEDTAGIPARITATYRNRYEIVCDKGTGFAHLKASEYYEGNEIYPTTGDFVMIDWQEYAESRILKTLPRKTCFSRLDPSSSGHYAQAIAANFDYVFIMQSLNHDFNARRLERYLTLSWQSGAIPVVILTKSDLVDDYSETLRTAERNAPSVCVYAVSSFTGEGISELSEFLKPGKTIVFLGSSGVGKSSLVNALAGEEIMPTSAIREDDSRGRHTTTHRQLIMLKSGAMIIDTPGMRELGMWDVSEGLTQSFNDVEEYMGKCKFTDCRHNSEPGCAIKAAISNGELSEERWESYCKLKAEAKYTENKEGYMREKQQWHKSITKTNRNMKKNGGIHV